MAKNGDEQGAGVELSQDWFTRTFKSTVTLLIAYRIPTLLHLRFRQRLDCFLTDHG